MALPRWEADQAQTERCTQEWRICPALSSCRLHPAAGNPLTRLHVQLVGVAGPQADCAAAAVHLCPLADQALQRHGPAGRAQTHVDAGHRPCDRAAARVQVRVKGFDLPATRPASRWAAFEQMGRPSGCAYPRKQVGSQRCGPRPARCPRCTGDRWQLGASRTLGTEMPPPPVRSRRLPSWMTSTVALPPAVAASSEKKRDGPRTASCSGCESAGDSWPAAWRIATAVGRAQGGRGWAGCRVAARQY